MLHRAPKARNGPDRPGVGSLWWATFQRRITKTLKLKMKVLTRWNK